MENKDIWLTYSAKRKKNFIKFVNYISPGWIKGKRKENVWNWR